MEWLRLYHGTISDPKWPLISKRSKQPQGVVVSVWIALLEFASQHKDRGSVEGFDGEGLDALYGYEDGTTIAVVKALESGTGAVLKDNRIVSWERRQPKREDGSSERAKAWREQKRTQANAGERKRTHKNADEQNRTHDSETNANRPIPSETDLFSEGEKGSETSEESSRENSQGAELKADIKKRTQTNASERTANANEHRTEQIRTDQRREYLLAADAAATPGFPAEKAPENDFPLTGTVELGGMKLDVAEMAAFTNERRAKEAPAKSASQTKSEICKDGTAVAYRITTQEGQAVRISEKQVTEWQASFTDISVRAELMRLQVWSENADTNDRWAKKSAYPAACSYLAKKNTAALTSAKQAVELECKRKESRDPVWY